MPSPLCKPNLEWLHPLATAVGRVDGVQIVQRLRKAMQAETNQKIATAAMEAGVKKLAEILLELGVSDDVGPADRRAAADAERVVCKYGGEFVRFYDRVVREVEINGKTVRVLRQRWEITSVNALKRIIRQDPDHFSRIRKVGNYDT